VISKPIALAAGAIGVLLIGSIALVYVLTEPTGGTGRDPGQAPEVAGTAGVPAGGSFPGVPTTPGSDGSPAPGWVPPPAPQQALLEPPLKGSWEEIPIVGRPNLMGAIGVSVARELQTLQPGVAACFDEDVQSRHGADGVSTMTYAPADEAGATVLVLQLETQPQAVRIADAPVETRGGASDSLIACAQAALRGRSLAVPGAKAGQRFRLRFTVAP
jgi:hypothetical protein